MTSPTGMTQRRRSKGRDAAFTAVELILVVLILAILAGMTVPNFSRSYKSFELMNEAQALAQLMRYAQSRAVTKGNEVRLGFLPDFSGYRLSEQAAALSEGDGPSFGPFAGRWGRVFKLPPSVKVQSEEAVIRFYADGSMDKRHVHVCYAERCLTVSTKEQRGHVRVWEDAER